MTGEQVAAGMERCGEVLCKLGCDPNLDGFALMLEFAARVAANGGGSRVAIVQMAQEHGTWYLAMNSRIRAAVRPALCASEAALAAQGVSLSRRNAYGLAEALADFFNSGG